MNYPPVKDLDGCYFRVCRGGKWQSLCISDLTGAERAEVLHDKTADWLHSLIAHLIFVLRADGAEEAKANGNNHD